MHELASTSTRLRIGLVFVIALMVVPATALLAQLAPGGTFTDDDGNPHEPNIEAVAAAGITNGCNPPANDRYCPSDPVTRAQMAAFLLRSIGVDPTGAVFVGTFTDVPSDAWYATWVEELARRGITTGYEDGTYRPNQPVSRAEMAALLLRTIGAGSTQPTGIFADVAIDAWYAGHVENMYLLGITTGCATDPLRYCPFDAVQRDELASFLARALGLEPIVPPPPTTTTTSSTTTTTTAPPSGGSLGDEWFLVDYDFSTYACHDDPLDFRFDQYECWAYYGSLPSILIAPDIYCSGPDWSLYCDPRWYPDELESLITIGYTDYVCNDSFSSYADWGDLDCVEYFDGDPDWVSTAFPDMYCSPAGFSSYDCNREYYPSEMDGRFFATISYNTYVCESTYQGDECHGPYYSGHPEAVIGWTPDYYCNWRGCSPYGYP